MLLLAVLGSACGKSAGAPEPPETVFDACEPISLEVAADALSDERESAGRAIAMWNEQAGTRIALDRPERELRIPLRFEEAAPLFFGIYLEDEGAIVINRTLRDDGERTITIAHEIGHAFGLLHVPPKERTSLMNPGNLEVGLTGGDAAELDRLWGPCP